MRRSWIALALLLLTACGTASAQDDRPSVPIAQWTPELFAPYVSSRGWVRVQDSPQGTVWVATNVVNDKTRLRAVVMKTSTKGPSGHATSITLIGGLFTCGANGSSPDYLQEPMAFTAFGDGTPIDAGPAGALVPITPGSIIAEAVEHECKHPSRMVAAETAAPIAQSPQQSSAPCSRPNAAYPIRAIRQGHQGVVYVTLTVGANERPTDIHVYKSSGFPELDASAMQAMANVVCNANPGAQIGMPVTFRLSGVQ